MEQPIVIDNLESIHKRLSGAGFGDRFDKVLADALSSGQTDIRLTTSEMMENKRIDFEADIKVKDGKGYYNGFKAALHEPGGVTEQWFKANDRITMNEAYMLLMDQQHPRAVHKTYFDEHGEKYGQWLQLDFAQKTESGNHLTKRFNDFDLITKLNDFDFVELSSVKQKAIAASHLSEGREVALTPINQENHQQVFIRANPERNTITILDQSGKLLYHDPFRTDEARQRIQEEKNFKGANVSFVKEGRKSMDIPSDAPASQDANSVKKETAESANQVTPNKRQRVLKGEANKGKSL